MPSGIPPPNANAVQSQPGGQNPFTTQWYNFFAGLAAGFTGVLGGLTLSWVSNTSYTVAAGGGISDDGTTVIQLPTAMTKTTAPWAAGNGAGSLDTGVVSAAAFYSVFVIENLTTLAVDVLMSLSATSPTMPAGYTVKLRVGSLQTSSSALVSFSQMGRTVLYTTPTVDASAIVPAITQTLITVNVPPGVKVDWIGYAEINRISANDAIGVYSPDQGAQGGNAWITGEVTMFVSTTATTNSTFIRGLRTNTSQQIAAASAGANASLYITTLGYTEL